DTLRQEDIVKGYQYEPGQFVIIESDDFEKVKLKSTKVIDIEGFVNADEIDEMLYDSPYFAGPDGDVASKTYSLLSQALRDSGKVGVGKVVLRDRESSVLLTPHERGIMIHKLRYANEIRSMKDVPNVRIEEEADEEQLKLANMLIKSMTKKFKKIQLEDKYNEALREMIDNKIKGNEVVSFVEEEPEVVDIMTALKASIDQAKQSKKPMKKADSKDESELDKVKRKAS
ncbi:MAG: Ku protein, partial [Ekhidna sp.]|nr:Ku protein [Ekhidna sp.]